MQTTLRIDPCDGTTARTDFDNVDNRRFDRKTSDIAVDVINRIHGEAAVFDQRAFRGSAAHIEGDDIFEPKLLGVSAGADAAADWTRFDQTNRLATSALGGQ